MFGRGLWLALAITIITPSAFAKTKILSRSGAGLTSDSTNPPTEDYPVYISDFPMNLETSDDCDTVQKNWIKAIHQDEWNDQGLQNNIDYKIVLYCDKTANNTIMFNPSGFVFAMNQAGADFLNQRYANETIFNTYGWPYAFDLAIASSVTVEIGHYITNTLTSPVSVKGFLPVRWSEITNKFQGLVDEFKKSDGPRRKELELDLAKQLRPDLSAEVLSADMDSVSDSMNLISFKVSPIFQTKYQVEPINSSYWSFDYKCSAKGQCYK